jgi:hypothetical protein
MNADEQYMTDKSTSRHWLVKFAVNILLPLFFSIAMATGMGWYLEKQDIKHAEKQRQDVAAGVALTSRGCPAARPIIREISLDESYSRHEIEVLDALVKAEQAKPGGLSACRAPSWRWFWGKWYVSKEYAK